MKFKATISHEGLRILTQSAAALHYTVVALHCTGRRVTHSVSVAELLPALEKHGKTCHVLLGPEEEILFEPQAFKCESRHKNLIGFKCEVALFRRVLQAAGAHDAECVEVKLAMRTMPGACNGSQGGAKPFLTFTCRGPNLNMVQDLPISKPHSPSQVDELLAANAQGGADATGMMCPLYLDLLPVAPRLLATTASLKAISSTLTLALVRQGHLHLQVAGSGVQLATEVQGLLALPAAAAATAPALRHMSAEGRLREALASGDAHTAVVQLKHLSRSLHSAQLTNPAQVLCGIAEGGGHVHLVIVYRSAHGDAGFDDKLSASYRLPVREDN